MFSLESENFTHSRLKEEMGEFCVLFATSSCATREVKILPGFVITVCVASQKGQLMTQATSSSSTLVSFVHTKIVSRHLSLSVPPVVSFCCLQLQSQQTAIYSQGWTGMNHF